MRVTSLELTEKNWGAEKNFGLYNESGFCFQSGFKNHKEAKDYALKNGLIYVSTFFSADATQHTIAECCYAHKFVVSEANQTNKELAFTKLKEAYDMLAEWANNLVSNREDSPTLGEADSLCDEAMKLWSEE